MTSDNEKRQRTKELETISEWLFIPLLTGLAVIIGRFLIVSLFSWSSGHGWAVQGNVFTSLLWALGWFAISFVFGFIFGVPKVLQTTPKASSGAVSAQASQTNASNAPYQLRVNTNLEEISDWLTKILVGATLTQLVKIPGLRVFEKECLKMYRPQRDRLIVTPGMYATLASSFLNVGEASFQ